MTRYPIENCEKVEIPQGAFYLGTSDKDKSVGYLELKPHSSLILHNRFGGYENLTQVQGRCVMVIFDTEEGTNHLINKGDTFKIEPEGIWHIHVNPFKEKCLTYWHFEGDIRHVIKKIRQGRG